MKMKICALIASLVVSVGIYAPHQNDILSLLEGKQNIIPVAIIGSGPAGLAATLPPVRAGYHTVVFSGEKHGGEIMESPIVENWLGLPKASGADCMHKLEQQATDLGAYIAHLTVRSADLSSWPFRLTLSDGATAYALTIVLATGTSQKTLGIENQELYRGKGLFSCGRCDASFTRGKDT